MLYIGKCSIHIYIVIYYALCFCEAKPTLPTNFEEDTWSKLKSAIKAIFLKQPTSCDLEKLYQVEVKQLSFFNNAALFNVNISHA